MTIPFILYEMDFDAEMFKKYYGSIDNPGIYAIPEDEVEPSSSPQENLVNSAVVPPGENPSEMEQNIDDKDKIEDHLSQSIGLSQMQLSQDEQAAYDKEVEPIKKLFLLNKLNQLAYLLKSKFSVDPDLELVLKFGSSLTYKTLQILAINTINHLRELAQAQEQQQDQQQQMGALNNVQQQEV